MTPTSNWGPRTLRADGVEIFAFECDGSSDRAPVVLLHGAGGNALTWMPVAPAFAGRRVLMVDMPAHGLSPRPLRWDLPATADAIARAVQHRLGNVAAIWGGHSWGGKVAGLIAAANPSNCRGLLLIDPSPSAAVPIDIEEFVDGTWGLEMQPYASPDSAADAAHSLRHWQPWDEETAAAFRHGLAQRDNGSWTLSPTREDLLALATATLHFDAAEMLAKAVSVPTLLLVAGESSAWQGVTNMLVYAAASQMVIPGNHWIHQANRSAVIAAVSSWLERLGC
jgi:pimeloyl-ACP methyl ester carboxylesterase